MALLSNGLLVANTGYFKKLNEYLKRKECFIIVKTRLVSSILIQTDIYIYI